MSILQSAYPNIGAKGYAGMVADGSTSNRITRTLEIASLPFGSPVYQGDEDDTCGNDEGNAFLGWAIATTGLGILPGVTADAYQQYDNVPILTMGTIFVECSTDAANQAPVYVTDAGLITDVATDNNATGWVFDETLAAAGLVRIARR